MVTDARSVTTTYGYNNRHQITSLAYNVTGDPTGHTAATAGVTLGYDAAGNRTSMTDGMGSATYNFNNLGQMYSETRSFNGLTPSYTLSYEYTLAGELKKITNNWSSSEIDYGYDNAGRLSNVGGAGYAGVTNYASALSYRAFGAIRSMNYGDGHALTTTYDNRLRPTSWNVANVLGYNYQYDGYYHENTGRVIYAQNISSGGGQTNGAADSSLDRSYEYDNVGRLAISHSGAEARAHVLNGQWGTMDGPYSLGFDYDVWGNLTHRYGWGGEVQQGGANQSSDIYYNYAGNRRTTTGFIYDAAGNLTNDTTETYQYDATGQQTSATWSAGSTAPGFTDDPLNPNGSHTNIKLVHLSELRTEVNRLRQRAGLAAVTNWDPDPNPQANVTAVHHNHITQLRAKLEEALNALQLPIGSYAHAGPNAGDTIYAIDFQELRDKIKGAWASLSSAPVIAQSYDGNGLRVKKNEYGAITYYVRSSILGGQVIAELDNNGAWTRGYVYQGSSLLAVQQNGVFWMHEDAVTKTKRVTDVNGNVVSGVEVDPFGADTTRSFSQAFQPRKYTTYERDGNGSDEAMFRRYNRQHSRFDQPDPSQGSYQVSDPQSFNRYAYAHNDPVNFVDPTGLESIDGGGDPDVDIIKIDTWAPRLFWLGYLDADHGWWGGDGFLDTIPMRPLIDPKNTRADLPDYVKNFYKTHQGTIDRCINLTFGQKADGTPDPAARIMERQTLQNAPEISYEMSQFQLQGNTDTPNTLATFGIPSKLGHGTVYIANDVPVTTIAIVQAVFHELGNILSSKMSYKLTGRADPYAYGDPNGVPYPTASGPPFLDKDTGARLERCIFGPPK